MYGCGSVDAPTDAQVLDLSVDNFVIVLPDMSPDQSVDLPKFYFDGSSGCNDYG